MLWLYKAFKPVIDLAAYFYFLFVNYVFYTFNFLKNWRAIDTPDDELLLIPAVEAADMIRRYELSSEKLVSAYIQRIVRVNGYINAMVMDNFADAQQKALEVDRYLDGLDTSSEEYAKLAVTKPLLGVPFTVKNNVYVKGFVCTAGVPARMRKAELCTEDAEAVKRLYDAGAILLGITNVPELGLWWETSNWIFGVTRNPYDLRRTAGGSSGGESALLSSAASLIGLGNDLGGSCRIPAAFCGVYGLKPSPGVIKTDGIFPEIKGGYMVQMVSAGPLCRYARDLSIMLRVLAGNEVADSRLKLNKPFKMSNARIFYMEGLCSPLIEPLTTEMRDAVRRTAKYFEKKYDRPTFRVDLRLAHHALAMYFISLDAAYYPKITESMTDFEFNLNCYTELVKHGVSYSEHTVPSIISGIHSTLPKHSESLISFVESKRDQLRREIIELLGDNGLLVFPAFPTTAPFVNQAVLTPFNFMYTALWNTLALPAIVCPLGVNRAGLPLSVQLVGAPDCERLLLAAAEDLEEAYGGWTMTSNRRRSPSEIILEMF